jgi:hypothetical protein
LWINEHFGEATDEGGIPFLESEDFKKTAKRLCGAVKLHKRNPATFGEDLKRMTKARLTFDQVMESPDFTIMEKQRLRIFAKDVFEQLQKIKF